MKENVSGCFFSEHSVDTGLHIMKYCELFQSHCLANDASDSENIAPFIRDMCR